MGTMFHQQQYFLDQITLLNPYHRFLQSVIYRQNAVSGLSINKVPMLYQLTKERSNDDGWIAQECPINDETSMIRYFNIQVIASADPFGNPLFTYYCDDIEFSPLEYGDKLLPAVANQILRHRNNEERYRAYITDLDISALNPSSRQVTCQYLEIKKQLEQQLYNAVSKV